jgi:YidC/Oxa1 family membrane protein insertase
MEKNTILAVVLSTLVLITFYFIQGMRFQQPQVQSQPNISTNIPDETPVQGTFSQTEIIQTPDDSFNLKESFPLEADESGPQVIEYITVETNIFTAILTNAGGDMFSLKLKEHFDKDGKVEMILSGSKEAHAFSIAFGGLDAKPVSSHFYISRLSDYSVEFYRDFISPANSGEKFRLIKRYDFKPNDYMFEMTVTLDGGISVPGINIAGNAYTLSFGPQIGPKFDKIDNRNEFRRYITFTNGKKKNAKINDIIDSRPSWAAISGKYFVFIAIPYLMQYSVSFTENAEDGLPSASRFNIIRPAVTSSRVSDTYRFYLGPKTQETLSIYSTGKNEFGLKDTQLVEAASSSGFLAPLEKLLKWLLLVFYKIVPNYGIAIILLTLFVKILFFPLTKKGSEATLRMQALSPKIKELQEKHKGNPQKLNAEMAAFYQKEGYNPVSGCLPMLLQIPIFIAMYNLFNNHFDLRGAMFIPGWIPDLSVPESILDFPQNFKLPILGWTALRALPFIYVGSQLIYGKVTQTPGQQTNSQMKMMLYVMPVMFFFILYNVPSGLLIYWIFSNVLTLAQQVIINKYNKGKQLQPEPEPVIAPKKRKK